MAKQIIYFYIVFLPFLFFSSMTIFMFYNDISILIFSFLIFYLLLIVKSVKLNGILSIYSIYLYTSFFFIYSRLLFDLIGYESFLLIGFPVRYTFTKNTGVVFILISFLSFYICDVVFSLKTIRKKTEINNSFKNIKNLEKIGIIMMLLMAPAVLYEIYLKLLFVREYGYLSIYTGELDNLVFPLWTRGTGTLFIVGYMLFITAYPQQKLFIKISFFYLFILFFDTLGGGRLTFLVALVSVIYFYYRFYDQNKGKKIKLKKIIMLFVGIVVFSVLIGNHRVNARTVVSTELIKSFFHGQGNTIGVPLFVIENRGHIEYRHFPFVFSNLIYPFFELRYGRNASLQTRLEYFNSLGRISVYQLHSEAYFRGAGLGGSFLAEMYDFYGVVGVIIWSSIFGLILSFFEKKKTIRQYTLPIYFFLSKTIIILPRNNFFEFVHRIHHLFIFIAVFYIIDFFIYPKVLLPRRIK